MSPRTRAPRDIAIVVPRAPSSLGLLTLQQAADELTIGRSSVQKLIALGKLKAIHPTGGKAVRIFKTDLEAFVAGLRESKA